MARDHQPRRLGSSDSFSACDSGPAPASAAIGSAGSGAGSASSRGLRRAAPPPPRAPPGVPRLGRDVAVGLGALGGRGGALDDGADDLGEHGGHRLAHALAAAAPLRSVGLGHFDDLGDRLLAEVDHLAEARGGRRLGGLGRLGAAARASPRPAARRLLARDRLRSGLGFRFHVRLRPPRPRRTRPRRDPRRRSRRAPRPRRRRRTPRSGGPCRRGGAGGACAWPAGLVGRGLGGDVGVLLRHLVLLLLDLRLGVGDARQVHRLAAPG